MTRNSNDRPTEEPQIVIKKSLSFSIDLKEGEDGASISWEDGVLVLEDGRNGTVTFVGAAEFDELRDALQALWYEIPEEE